MISDQSVQKVSVKLFYVNKVPIRCIFKVNFVYNYNLLLKYPFYQGQFHLRGSIIFLSSMYPHMNFELHLIISVLPQLLHFKGLSSLCFFRYNILPYSDELT